MGVHDSFNSCPANTGSQLKLIEFLDEPELAQCICQSIVEKDGGKVFKEILMPIIFKKFRRVFTEFSCDIVSYFGVGQREVQDILLM